MLHIDTYSLSTVTTLSCSGSLIFGMEVETLRSMVQSRREEHIRINLSGIDRIDASGLGLLVELQVWARESRRTVTLVDLSEPVWRMVILTKLYAALEVSYSGVPVINGEHDDFERNELIA
jgi:anti-anti-sigma factor